MSIKRKADEVVSNEAPSRLPDGYRPRKMCHFFLDGRCTRGDSCTFAHAEEELDPQYRDKKRQVDVAGISAKNELFEEADVQAQMEQAWGLADEAGETDEAGIDEQANQRDASKPTHGEERSGMAATQRSKQWLPLAPLPRTLSQTQRSAEQEAVQEPVQEAEPSLEEELLRQEDVEALHSASVLLGPREFHEDSVPTQLCQQWLIHPAFCEQGDACLMAHGLAELGIGPESGVVVRTDGSPAAAVTVEDQKFSSAVPSRAPAGDRQWPAPIPAARPNSMAKGCSKGSKGCSKGGCNGWWSGHPQPGPAAFGGGCGGGWTEWWPPQHPGPIVPPAQQQQMNRFQGSKFLPTKICNFWLQDPSMCSKGWECTFAHGVQELQPDRQNVAGVSRFHHMQAPTKLCTFWNQGLCNRGLWCTFAHSPEELASHARGQS
mmetsp:Transcript_125850/g.245519  ORF Transcript_125850/g.245519 Transcript_125850/m.245519 type:complete len:433 (+) Transcript_125850:66-1364(+)